MKKLLKEAGIALISAITGAGGNNEIIREVIKMLSSSAYDRSLEDEADQTGADYLCNTGIDPIHMANFFLRLSEKDDLPEMLDWISTHKDSKERTAAILQLRKKINCSNHFNFSAAAWESVQQAAQ
ncbi:MAG: M48 family metalloprotease [Chitinophagaceae bacterium]